MLFYRGVFQGFHQEIIKKPYCFNVHHLIRGVGIAYGGPERNHIQVGINTSDNTTLHAGMDNLYLGNFSIFVVINLLHGIEDG